MGYPLNHKVGLGMAKGIPLSEYDEGQLVYGHLGANYFLTIFEDYPSYDNTMEFLHIFYLSLGSYIK